MNPDPLKNIFDNHSAEFDTEQLMDDHEMRFLEKLNIASVSKKSTSRISYLQPIIAVAASIIICLGLFVVFNQGSSESDLASVSEEMSNTQDFFTQTIASELNKINEQRTPETEILINDALKQLASLEKEYVTLKTDLKNSGQDKRVIYAMISNFQSRIEILQNVLEQIENINNFKNQSNESTII
ncbi:hypothetical protein [Paucihalobacter sp.]|uniref:hypothetical protein n=1 Tax=Paucihalobacter sp. TaxID=2850405 RepID=UPI002FE2AF09